MIDIPVPTSEIVNLRLKEWNELEKYVLQERCLNLLFQDLVPGNERIEDILIKVSALNDFYSTNIYDTHSVARHIASMGIASPVEVGGKIRRFYSFASKYCSHHHPEKYPIYDRYVEKMLIYFRNKCKFAKFTSADLKDYTRFVPIVQKFSEAFDLTSFTLKEVDAYLWLTGKKHFNAYGA